ncbi:hypothetical protein B0H13DRAFT_2339038 [Mycena leptocephala]|nr:hypothetical protein B0H13DRAFT_2339038 [Mycena leptocephala]
MPAIRTPTTHSAVLSHPYGSLASIRRLPSYEDQYDALAANPDLYKLEGDGVLYVTTVIDDADVRAVRSGTLTASALKKKLTFKLGHTNSLARHCPQYRKCEQDQTHLWLWYYEVDRRYVAERMSHLKLLHHNAHATPDKCQGCKRCHREFFHLKFVGGLEGLHGIVKKVLTALGQPFAQRVLFTRPTVLGDIWDMLL